MGKGCDTNFTNSHECFQFEVISVVCFGLYPSPFLCCADESGYLAEQNKARPGEVSVGKNCIRFRKLEDLNLKVVLELVQRAAKLGAK